MTTRTGLLQRVAAVAASLALLAAAGCGEGTTSAAGSSKASGDGGSKSSGAASKTPAAASAPTKKSDPDRALHYNIGAEPKTLDPAMSTEIPGSVILKNVFEGLTRTQPDGSVEPAAAQSWEISEDGKTYTFKLRPAGQWSNGDPLAAEDFVYSWRRALDPDFGAEYAYVMYPIVGVEHYNTLKRPDGTSDADWTAMKTDAASKIGVRALDSHTFQLELRAPTPYLLSFLDHSTFNPVHRATVEANPDTWWHQASTYVCNGPYAVREIEPKKHVMVTPNERHRDFEKVKLKKIYFNLIEDSGTALTEFETGRLDGIDTGLPPADMARLQQEGKLKTMPLIGTYFVCYNTTKPPFDNKLVRQAFSQCLNRQAIALLSRAGYKPANAFVSRGIAMSPSDTRDFRDVYQPLFQDNQVDAAKKALADAGYAGYAGGSGFPEVSYIYNTDDLHKLVAEVLGNQWKQGLGVNVRLQNQEWKVLQVNRTEGNFEICRHGWVADYADPMSFLDMFLTNSGNNDANWSNAEYDALVEAARSEGDAQKRMDMLAQAEKLLIDDYAIAPLLFYQQNYVLTDDLAGVERSIMQTSRFDRAYWK
jgi:oligopeptide transport system substrate-binding protein